MAVEIMPARTEKKKKSHVLDFIIIGFVILCIIIAIIVFSYGYSDYSEMKDMQLTWTEIVDIANTDDPNKPIQFVEFSKTENQNTDILPVDKIPQGIILSDMIVPPKKEDVKEVNINQTQPNMPVDYLYRSINLNALRQVNKDVSGYIYIPNTKVDYPILKETEAYKYYYLNHDIKHKVDKYGSIFELTDEERNTDEINNAVNIIFGHNMKSGAMFAGVTNYRNTGYMNNPVYVYRDDYRIEYQAFAFCTIDCHESIYDFDAYELGSDNYKELLEWIKSKSDYEFTTSLPDINDPIVVLSTCRDANSNVRQILCLKEVRRAMVPEYYETLQEVYQYGGNSNGIVKEEE